jgi:hypothetical protein
MNQYRVFVLLTVFSLSAIIGHAQERYIERDLKPSDHDHWSFKPPVRPEVPNVLACDRKVNPVDAFITQRLQQQGLKLSPMADRRTLIRRLSLDVIGLPPTPNEVEEFLKDESPHAYEKLVDRLLASPHYGERQAQHWLDVVRFAESNGFELDEERPQAWRYRDYVIKSFNNDKPFDQFIIEQVAGDELAAEKNPRDVADLWIATGMHRCGPVHMVAGNLDAHVVRQEKLTEMVNGVGTAFLGLTVGCARCHDHKFDPISAGDYYRLQAFFASSEYVDIDLSTSEEREARKRVVNDLEANIHSLKKQIADLDAPYKKQLAQSKRERLEPKYRQALDTPAEQRTPEQKKLVAEAGPLLKVTWEEVLASLSSADRERRAALREQQHALEAQLPPPPPAAWAIRQAKPTATFVLKRGDPYRKATLVNPGFIRVLSTQVSTPKTRLELGKWIASNENPLTARVIVNRLWQQHFGKGIVPTPNDFGTRGEPPSHPELLDWLACELMQPSIAYSDQRPLAWSLKHIHRLILTSETYKQSTTETHGNRIDPNNHLLWRQNRRRLDAEAIRDAILTSADTLNRQLGGVSIKIPLEPEVYDLIFTEGEPDGLWLVTPDQSQHTRRSIYLFNKRNVRLPMFEAFDQPDTLNSCAVRPESTFAPQALILMNGPFVREQGKALAIKLTKEFGPHLEKQITALYRRTLGRLPEPSEVKLAQEFLREQVQGLRDRLRARLPIGIDTTRLPSGTDPATVRAMADLAVVIFNTHEFVYIP